MQLNHNKIEEALSHRGVELKVSQEVECSHSQQRLEEEHSLSEELLNQQEEVLYKGLKEEVLSLSLLGVEVRGFSTLILTLLYRLKETIDKYTVFNTHFILQVEGNNR